LENLKQESKVIWMSLEMQTALNFIKDIVDKNFEYSILYATDFSKDNMYNIAKEIYEKSYKDTLPISYLEYYKP